MAKSEAKRQKRLAKQKAKRNEKRQAISRQKSMGLAERLGRFEKAPVLNCLVNEGFEEAGIANVFIGRKAASGELAVAHFLVDIYCLGVKDCFARITDPAEYRDILERFREQGVRAIDPASARKLIEDGVEFARSLGFSPHGDYRKAKPILNGIDPAEARETFEMGKDGCPFYIQGPYDSPADVARIMAAIQPHGGTLGHNPVTLDSSRLDPFYDVEEDYDFEEDSDEFDEE